MKLLLCMNRDFMANRALNMMWPRLAGHEVDIMLSRGVGVAAARAEAITAWQALDYDLTENLLYPNLISPDGFRSFESIAGETVSRVIHYYPSINSGEGLAYVERFKPDLILSVRFGHIFKAPVIAMARHGILNLHSGLLPQYRGVLATFWAMHNNEKTHGCTLHTISDASIDTGPVTGVDTMALDWQRSLLWNVASLYPGGMRMMADAVHAIAQNGGRNPILQHGEGSYYSYPLQEHYQQFLDNGGSLYTANDYLGLFDDYDVSAATREQLMIRLGVKASAPA